ncbi:antitoxin Xre/MbcA/ParS toxin-binding domain-containing protein [Microbacterium oxydans]|uniref:antitoxin Xre/MbcA/ParS toxin-binding domain-containing protein n=1 Tax=Microbacterium TaxID=33882 RepID=UPI002598C391|nr:antitoxin Xre/MbcA/ParS toxin-binding domain-containing protein [uncultured Microbacterium sp.]
MSDGSDGAAFGQDAARLGRDLVAQGVASDVEAVRERLSALWTDPAIEVWLTSANAHLDGARPTDVLALNGLETVMEAIDIEVAGGSR